MAASFGPTRLAAALTFALSVFPTAHTARADDQDLDSIGEDDADEDEEDDADPRADTQKDEADRAYVAGRSEGALAAPIALRDEAGAAKLCEALQGERNAKGDANLEQLKTGKHVALRNVYTVVVAPGGFRIGEYRSRAGRLPLRLEHPMSALDGALRLIVAQKAGGSFDIAPKDAGALVGAIDEKKIGLEVVFRVDGGSQELMTACFSYPKSAAYALNIEPLTFALVELGNNNRHVAEAQTPALEELKTWMDPGKARLSIVASGEGAIDSDALTKAVEAKRGELEACFSPLMQSPSATGMVAYEASVSPGGAVSEVRVEAESLDDDQIDTCTSKVIRAVAAPRAGKASKAHFALSIERGEDSIRALKD